MFKAILIEDINYYKFRGIQVLYFMLLSLPIGLLVNSYDKPIWVTIIATLLFAAVLIFVIRNQKEIVKIANKKIELDKNQIRLKDSKGILLETIILKQDHTIKVNENYTMGQETMSELKEEIKGNGEQHFIVLEQNDKERRFDFQINSYYMLNQLNKVVKLWQTQDYKVEYV